MTVKLCLKLFLRCFSVALSAKWRLPPEQCMPAVMGVLVLPELIDLLEKCLLFISGNRRKTPFIQARNVLLITFHDWKFKVGKENVTITINQYAKFSWYSVYWGGFLFRFCCHMNQRSVSLLAVLTLFYNRVWGKKSDISIVRQSAEPKATRGANSYLSVKTSERTACDLFQTSGAWSCEGSAGVCVLANPRLELFLVWQRQWKSYWM